ncbi:hypothetical protein MTR67_043678 [Solanum verrucosum]|uniref:Uncharacterized protein n=1 Tax=Solanum verrucosum TaxID=315347 RepID=A0AAF0URV0_SOLVR|nr:hypothetical protein MTR67_043678 [Solanum verrucosum]
MNYSEGEAVVHRWCGGQISGCVGDVVFPFIPIAYTTPEFICAYMGTDLCHRDDVPFVVKIDDEVTIASSTDIWRLKVEYTKDKAEWRKKSPVATSHVVNLDSIEADTTPPAQADEPSSIPAPSPSVAHVVPSAFQPLLTKAMLYKMCNLSYSFDITYHDKATQTETEEEDTIEKILKAITTLCTKVDSMDNEIQKLKTDEDNLKSKASQQHDYKNVELRRSEDRKNPELKGDDGKLLKTHKVRKLFRGVNKVEALGNVDACDDHSSDMAVTFEIPPATLNRDVSAGNDYRELDRLEKNEAEFRAHENSVFYDLEDLEGDLVQVSTKASLSDTSKIGPSGSHPIVEVDTHSKVRGELGTDS